MFSLRRRMPARPTRPDPNSMDAAGFRSMSVGSVAGDSERFRRNRAIDGLIGRRRAAPGLAARAAVLIPVDRIAGRSDRIRQGEPIPIGPHEIDVREDLEVNLLNVNAILVDAQIGATGGGEHPAEFVRAEGASYDIHLHRSQSVARQQPETDVEACYSATEKASERVGHGEGIAVLHVDRPGISGAIDWSVGVESICHCWSDSQ